tara:strand:+ start:1335 stop:1961 length:627 start_codon:yes stop_codon:yes gene_type:complete
MNNYKHNGNGTTTIIVESKTHGTFNITIDTEDYHPKVEGRRWHIEKAYTQKYKDVFYVRSNIKRLVGKSRQTTTIRLHRLITNAPKGMQVDHISGNTLDNTKANLRIVTNRENQENRARNQAGASKYKGVVEIKSRTKIPKPSRWMARASIDGENKYLGTYAFEESAAEEYDLEVCRLREIINPSRQLNYPERLKEYKEHLEKNSSES